MTLRFLFYLDKVIVVSVYYIQSYLYIGSNLAWPFLEIYTTVMLKRDSPWETCVSRLLFYYNARLWSSKGFYSLGMI